MKLIVGLGNPGLKYKKTRHNIGFDVVDELASRTGEKWKKNHLHAHTILTHLNGEKVLIMKPQTFMNLSGQAVEAAMNFYDIEPDSLVVIYDDLDLPTASIRLRQKGGHGGHNGMRDIINRLDTKAFNRIRFGVDKPTGSQSTVQHVLGKFSKAERKDVDVSVVKAADACEAWMERPFIDVMNEFNG